MVQDFDYRSRRIIKEIFGCSANQQKVSDIICLQEVDNYENVYKPEFDKRGYSTEIYWRSEKDGVLIGYNKEKFEVLDRQPICYKDVVKGLGLDESYERWNGSLMCLLQHRESGKKFIVVCTHHHWDCKYDYVKFSQGVWLLK